MQIHADIRTVRAADLPVVDVIVGSPPCQDLSTANSRAAGIDGTRSGLFFEAIRLVGECRPHWGCFENVPASRTRGIDRACAALEALDYACWPIVVGADCAGAPHIRERLWLVFADPARLGRRSWTGQDIAQPEPQGRCKGNGQQHSQSLAGCERRSQRRHPARLGSQNGHAGHALSAGLAFGQEQPARQERAPAQRAVRADDAADLDQPGRAAFREGRGYDPFRLARRIDAEIPAFECNSSKPWPHWSAGLPDLALLDDGPAAELARNGALYRAICAAQGDAIVPQVAYQIVRAMMPIFPEARRVLDLFAGAVGGWAYACRWAGLDVVAACEIDPWRREVYRAVHHPTPPRRAGDAG